jgi:glutamyl-tRNA synthetase
MENGGQKLSKSAGSTSIKYLREQGKKPAEIYQEILKMAGAGIDYEVSTWQQLAESIVLIKQGGAETN